MEQKIDIDLIPLTSMALIILLILMLISPHISRSDAKVELPVSETAGERKEDNVTLTLSKNGEIDVSGSEISIEQLMPFLKKKLAVNKEAVLLIRADKNTYYSDIEQILKIGQICGAKRIALATEKEE